MITLSNMHEHTAQEVFDVCALHLLTQNKRAVGSGGDCVYRSPCGLKCAIGVLISDEEYTENMEESDVHKLTEGTNSEPHRRLLNALQYLHDEDDLDLWTDGLIRLANTYGLSDKLVVNFKRGK